MAMLATLEDLLIEHLRDLYDAEHQILKALPKMIDTAQSPDLKQALRLHLQETDVQGVRLETILTLMGQRPGGHARKAMQGIIKEGDDVINERATSAVKDAALIAVAQRVEHDEIAGYGCAPTWATLLGMNEVAAHLQQTLDEEGATDKKLTALAEQVLNIRVLNA